MYSFAIRVPSIFLELFLSLGKTDKNGQTHSEFFLLLLHIFNTNNIKKY